MKYTFSIFFSCVILVLAYGQQTSQYSMYMLNKFSFNPAYAGLEDKMVFTGVFRKQWAGLPGSPAYQNVNVHTPFGYLRGGLGINFENDAIGAEQIIQASIAYNYHIPVGKVGIFALGIAGGLHQKSLDGALLRTPEGDYSEPNILDHRDGILPIGVARAQVPIFQMGLYYYSNSLEIGLSANNLIEPTIKLSGLQLQLKRHYFATLSYNIDFGGNLTFHPSVLLKSDLVETQIDFSLLLRYNENIFGGASFRGYSNESIDAVAIIVGFKANEKITIAYSYDLTLSVLNSVSTGSHEVMLRYDLDTNFGKGVPPNIIYNPRFL